MKLNAFGWSIICLLIFGVDLYAQSRHKKEIPFTMVGSSIVIEVKINNSTPLNLIFDTGVRNTIITELWSEDSMAVNTAYERELSGLGTGTPAIALLALNNSINIGSAIVLDSANVLVLKSDVFELSRHLGTKINGLIGYEILKNWVVYIDYDNFKIRFYDPLAFMPPRRFEKLPMAIEKEKALYHTQVKTSNGETHDVKLLLDTGAELGLWLTNYNYLKIPLPNKTIRAYIGAGLSGPIFGYIGVMEMVKIGSHSIVKPFTAFPDSMAIQALSRSNNRSGSIGSEILQKFNIIFNYHDSVFYIQRNHNFAKPTNYNRTGIEIVKENNILPILVVSHVWPNSPAELAGILPGDQLLTIDNLNCMALSLSDVKYHFYSVRRGKMYIKLQRQEQVLKVKVDINKME